MSLLKIIMFFREVNWLAVSSLSASIVALIVASIPNAAPAPTIALTGLSISLALLALRD